MALQYFRGDERPYWQGTVTVSGVADDMSSGFTFTVKIASALTETAVLTKTTGITGGTGGVFTVAWATNDLDIAPGEYVATCTARRTSDSKDWTVSERLTVKSVPA